MRARTVLVTVCGMGIACQSPSPPADLLLENVTVVDVRSGAVRPGQDVFVDGAVVSAVLETGSRLPDEAQVVDGTGMFVIPGLWDMHVHSAANARWHFPAMLAHGVTGVRNMHSTVDDALGLVDSIRSAVSEGRTLGPRFVGNGPIVDGDPPSWPGAVVVGSPDEARAAVDSLAAGGAEFVKVYDRVGLDAFRALMDRAAEREIPVDGHLPAAVTAAEAASLGMRTIEHLSGMTMGCSADATGVASAFADFVSRSPLPFPESELEYFGLIRRASDTEDPELCRAVVEAYLAAGVVVSPTLVGGWSANNASTVVSDTAAMRFVPASLQDQWALMAGSGPGQAFAEIMAPVYEASLRRLAMLHAAGVPVVAGTDLGNPFLVPGRSLHDELSIYVGAGMTPREALQTATINPAEVLGLADSLGIVAKGYLADLVLLGADPVANIENVRRVRGVVRAGRYHSEEDLVRLVEVAVGGGQPDGQ